MKRLLARIAAGALAASLLGAAAQATEDVARDWFVGGIVLLKTKLKK
jgi:hypothetical protein